MAFLGQEEQLREFQDRFKFVNIAIFIGLGILFSRLVFLQILSGDRLRESSEKNRIKRVTIAAPRGMIFDRNQTLLIDNQPAFDLHITPQYLKDSGKRREVLEKLSELIDVPVNRLERRLRKARSQQAAFRPVKIKTDLTRDEVAKIESWKIAMPGVSVKMEIQRTNIYKDVASHLLGYINKVNSKELPRLRKLKGRDYKLGDSIGKVGIEKEMEDYLRGRDGVEIVEVDALGRRVRGKDGQSILDRYQGEPAVPGKNLTLTIDQDLQLAATRAFKDQPGALVAIDPNNGEILSMISRPSYDPTQFSKIYYKLLNDENKPLRDKTLQEHYMPGSVFKVVTAITALQEGVINRNTTFKCQGVIRIGRRLKHCWKAGGHGDVNVVEALGQSCNIFFYRAAQKLKSVNSIAQRAAQMGLGQLTGIPLSREVPGLIPTEEWKYQRFKKEWTPGETVSVAIGQSYVLTTIVQLANLYATIANGGKLYEPYFVRSIESHDGQLLEKFEPKLLKEVAIEPKVLEPVKKGLWYVINHKKGTAFHTRMIEVEFVGKTGTAQVKRFSSDKLYQKCSDLPYRSRHHSLFAGFAPAENPKIAAAAIVVHGCGGGRAAAPVVREVLKTYMKKLYPEKFEVQRMAMVRVGEPEISEGEASQ